MILNGHIKNNALVQLADMINHSGNPNCEWVFNEQKNGLQIKALKEIERGDKITYSYGNKSNARYLLNYGFVVDQNYDDETLIPLQFDKQDVLYAKKLEFAGLKNELKIMKLQQVYDKFENNKTYGFLRYILIDDENVLLKLQDIHKKKMEKEGSDLPYNPINTPPINLKIEQKMWATLNLICFQQLQQYPQTLEEDYQQLKNTNLSSNQRNCLTIVTGEKEILFSMLSTSQLMIDLMSKENKELLQSLKDPKYMPYANYLLKIVLGLLKK
ncbi:Rubisco LSMT, substrate-binding domain [Pseudocohnilembus persalinus]|uniref:Rubisco LSMT, substrate-binding domain n=1 Tax=Pseudocohnilembus persalinus TaxID=266149 RepID=A0A0V0QVF4_PSEPJ|nr:Rubisco LSMT, substrate-binding domain [Pseudocohnilembus persalinus]|eukprot:KRX06042.1 Rubisco LSMT, substrate-binding domain [Pseudocohnilembus persalinus]